ncbi:conjugative transposon TraN protein [Chitinophaga terrae (ex Kim and Jung 2007)]|uniref:DUF4138 domain-containing protein n=1 Tax=Chitinophaga terrae (ex Kim and Jung 2007) TaxID=408074 RepID=UPI0027892BF4|nr:DUF4138 domain-containing protein [Chitinophaga terrae (ex Kim and Jung 2007)]MDQ0107458.1 conjugative transposon TraN protein [Chitinophaga terrae (ex Kim and Jung 2007)]
MMRNEYVKLLLAMLFIIVITGRAWSQTANVAPRYIGVSDQRTTTIVFHAVIKAVDRGHAALMAEKMNDTILKIKAATPALAPTNLSVVTADGVLFTFEIAYNPSVRDEAINILPPAAVMHAVNNSPLSEDDITRCCTLTAAAPRYLHRPSAGTERLKVGLGGVFYDRQVIFLQIRVQNKSALPFSVDFMRVSLSDRRTRKRKIKQEIELVPLHSLLPTSPILPGETSTIVLALKQFSVVKQKKLLLQLFERGGGRHQVLAIRNKALFRIKPISVLTTAID